MVTQNAPADERALLKRITVRPDVFGGKPIIRDMRISVDMIISLMVQGETEAVKKTFKGAFGADLHVADAGEQFLRALAGVTLQLEVAAWTRQVELAQKSKTQVGAEVRVALASAVRKSANTASAGG